MESLSNSAKERLWKNLDEIRNNITAACKKAGTIPDSVRLVAVTKKIFPDVIDNLGELHISDIGENRVQEAHEKIPSVRSRFRWHMIGHLQTNKVKRAAEIFSVVHSIDSERLAEKLNQELENLDKTIECFIQVNFTDDGYRHGTSPHKAEELAETIRAKYKRISLKGLMTMAPVYENPDESRLIFRKLREMGGRSGLAEFSMGMSDDYIEAVEEGATIIRIGRRLFEGVV